MSHTKGRAITEAFINQGVDEPFVENKATKARDNLE